LTWFGIGAGNFSLAAGFSYHHGRPFRKYLMNVV
jgi:hypothetical protein